MNSIISDIRLRQIYDSRGKPTVEAALSTSDGKISVASAPSGTSTSKYEAVAFPNGDVALAIRRFKAKKQKFVGMSVREQSSIDAMLHKIDKTRNFSFIGGNVATAVSIAAARSAAEHEGMELYHYINETLARRFARERMPRHLGNIIGGGVHAKSKMKIQELLVSPDAGSFSRNAAISIGLRSAISAQLGISAANIEGALVTNYDDIDNLRILAAAAKKMEAKEGVRIDIGVDMAASEYFKSGKYMFRGTMGRRKYINFVIQTVKKFGLRYVEDPVDASDFRGFSEITTAVGLRTLVVGDDLYATSGERLMEGVRERSTNGVLIKVNQVGTLTDTLNTVEAAKRNGIACVVSHRSGETTDTFISHLAVGIGAEFIKCGIVGGERIAKINELMRIEKLLR